MEINKKELIKELGKGEIAVIPTDTIYGLVGSAKKPKAVEKIYRLKSRNLEKPLIILIKSTQDLKFFGIKLSKSESNLLKNLWPGKISIILPCPYEKFSYLHRGAKKLAFRLPKKKSLLEIIKKTGPLVAPSANPEGKKPATNISEAKKYFGNEIRLYFGQNKLKSRPSTLIELKKDKIKILRQGGKKIKKSVL